MAPYCCSHAIEAGERDKHSRTAADDGQAKAAAQQQQQASLLTCLSSLAAMPQLSDDGEPAGWPALQASVN